MKIDIKNVEYAKIQVKLLNYNTILTSAQINRLFLPIPDYTDCSNNRPDYAYGCLIGTALTTMHVADDDSDDDDEEK